MKRTYTWVKEYITGLLEKAEQPLGSDEIDKNINSLQDLASNLEPAQVAFIVTQGQEGQLDIGELTDQDWMKMKRELQGLFNVEQDRGVALMSKKERTRKDKNWWTLKEKNHTSLYYWERYKRYMSESHLPHAVIQTIDDDTDTVMDLLENPKTDEPFSTYGMVVGHVQSGKTGNYSALISKAADAGYKFIVVIAGALNNLRDQTQERLNLSFIGRNDGVAQGVGKYRNSDLKHAPITLTTRTADFNKRDADRAGDLDMGDRPVIMVIKKNGHTLSNVINWLNSRYPAGVKDHSMLLIDDESDYASVNTKEEEDPTSINRKIRELLAIFEQSAYVAYTATPYANIFIDYEASSDQYGDDLFPSDFIYGLKAPTNYFGAKKIFLDTEGKHLEPVFDHEMYLPMNHKKDFVVDELSPSLEEAVRLFVLNIAIRHLRHQGDKHNSMMIHVTRFTDVHHEVYLAVSKYFDQAIKHPLQVDGKMPDRMSNKSIQALKRTFDKFYGDKQLEENHEWDEVLDQLVSVIHTVHMREVHQQSRVPLIYSDDEPGNYIVVGGTSLSRGYTLEGLTVSYFLRSTVFYDTLMQMGRWFGYRDGYEDLCHIFSTNDIFYKFQTIIEATEDLMDDLDRMRGLGLTPSDFGLAVKQHPDSGLLVTARNKLKNTETVQFEMKLDGHIKETSWLDKDEETLANNEKVVERAVQQLREHREPTEKNLWKDVPREWIQQIFEDFTFYGEEDDLFGLYSRMPVKFVKEYIETIDTNWDVVIPTGQGQQEIIVAGESYGPYQVRKVDQIDKRYEFRNRQVSSGQAEELSLSTDQIEELKQKDLKRKNQKRRLKERKITVEEIDPSLEMFSRRKEARRLLERPLLMLHFIEATIFDKRDRKKEVGKENLVALSVSFPGGIESGNKNILLQVNKVYLDKLVDEMQQEEDLDDAIE